MFRIPFPSRSSPPKAAPKEKATPSKVVILADGSIAPECSGAGIVAHDEHGLVLAVSNRTLPKMNNNEAEYAGLILALEWAAAKRYLSVEIRMDSEVVVYQMIGRFAVNSPALKAWHRKACALARTLPQVTYRYIPREQNRLADALAADAVVGKLWHTDKAARP